MRFETEIFSTKFLWEGGGGDTKEKMLMKLFVNRALHTFQLQEICKIDFYKRPSACLTPYSKLSYMLSQTYIFQCDIDIGGWDTNDEAVLP